MNGKSLLMIALSVLVLAFSAFAVKPTITDSDQLHQIAQRMINGETVEPSEKAAAYEVFQSLLNESRSNQPPATDLIGGPDAFGYMFIDSQEPTGGPTFSWVEHTTAAVNVDVTTGFSSQDDGYAGPFPLGFSFNLYDASYTQMYMSTNGYLTFTTGSGSIPSPPMPISIGMAAIAFWARDMHVGYGGTTVRYEAFTNPTRMVVTYDSLSQYASAGSIRVSAQIIMYQGGEIRLQYRNYVGTGSTAAIGIQNAATNISLGYAPPMPPANTVVRFFLPCARAQGPFLPADYAIQQPDTVTMRWGRGPCHVTSTVFFSADSNAVLGSSLAARVLYRSPDTTYRSPTVLQQGTMYFWKVLAYNSDFTDSTSTGMMRFRTYSPGISGIRTIGGTNPDYATITEAIQAVNASGTGTGVTFMIRGGTYTETPNEFLATAMGSPTSPIIFRPADTLGVIINAQCTSTAPYAFKISNCDNVVFDGRHADAPGRNLITVNATTTAGYYGFWFMNGSDNCRIQNVDITVGAPATTSSAKPIYVYYSTTVQPVIGTVNDSIIDCKITGGYYNMYLYGTSTVQHSGWYIKGNEIVDFNTYGMYLYYFHDATIKSNKIHRTAPNTSTLYGIYPSSGGTQNNVYDGNWIYDMFGGPTSTVYGMYMYYGANRRITNNMIVLDANAGATFYGMYLGSEVALVANNSIRVSGTAGGSYNSACIYHGTTSQDSVYNNILVNNRTGGTATQYHVGFYAASATSFAYSNNNIIIAGSDVPTDNGYAARIGTNNYNTLADLRASGTYPHDTQSVGIEPAFVSATNLHIPTGQPTPVESAGRLGSVTWDFDNQIRSTTFPDIGADEGEFATAGDLIRPLITATPLGSFEFTTARTIDAIITDNVGVAPAPNNPRLYYKRTVDTTYAFVNATTVTDSLYTFTIPGFPLGSIVQYYIAAQDTSGNLSTWPFGGAGTYPPGTVAPSNPYTYYIATLLTGTKTVGATGCDYPTLTMALNAIRSVGVGAAGVTFELQDSVYNEPSMEVRCDALDMTRPVVIKPANGVNATINVTTVGAGLTSALRFNRVRNVTFDGRWSANDSVRHLTFNVSGTAVQEVVRFADSTDHNTINYVNLWLGITNSSTYRVAWFGNTGTQPELPIVGNRIMNSDLFGGYYSVYMYGNTTERIDSTQLINNNIRDFYYYGVYSGYNNGSVFKGNRLYHTTPSASTFGYGLNLTSQTNGAIVDGNLVSPTFAGTASMYGIYVSGTGDLVTNNMVNIGAACTGTMYGIYQSLSNASTRYLFNTVKVSGTATTSSSYCMYFSSTTGSDSLYGNIFQNVRTGTSTTAYHVGIYASSTPPSYSNFNMFDVGSDSTGDQNYIVRLGTTNINSLTDLLANTTWQPRDAQSFNEPVPFVSPTDLHIDPNMSTALESGAPQHAAVPMDFDMQARTGTMTDIGADAGTFRTVAFGTISGIVRDSIPAMPPMEGVTVTMGRYSTVTDQNGRFLIDARSGLYDLSARIACWLPTTVAGIVIDSSSHDSIVIYMYHAEFAVNPTTIEWTQRPGTERSQSVIINNRGNGPLTWNARYTATPPVSSAGRDATAVAPVDNAIKSSRYPGGEPLNGSPADKAAYENWMSQLSHPAPSAVDSVWGPDGGGYTTIDNAESNWPTTVVWRDISTIGTSIFGSTDDGGAATTTDGFQFSFYGDSIPASIWVCSNGFIQFAATGSTSLSNTTLPQTTVTNAIIPLWDDLVTSAWKYYDAAANIFYVQWNGYRYSTSSDTEIFQVQLHGANNAIVFLYNTNVTTPLSPTIGIQHNSGTNNEYTQCYFSATAGSGFPIPLAGYALAFSQSNWETWLRVTPTTGVIMPRESMEITVVVEADSSLQHNQHLIGSVNFTHNACPSPSSIPINIAIDTTTTGVGNEAGLVGEYKLYQNYPNPFNPSTEIRFNLKNAGYARLAVYDVLGRQVSLVVNERLPQGAHAVRFDATRLSNGVYFYRLESGGFSDIKKMVLVK